MTRMVLTLTLVLLLGSAALAQQPFRRDLPLTKDLLSWWRGFPGFTGSSVIYDQMPARNHGGFTGNTFWAVTSSVGQPVMALQFDGTADGVVAPGDVGTPTALTLVAWFTSVLTGGGQIVSLDNSVVLYIVDGVLTGAYYDGTSSPSITSSVTITTSDFHVGIYATNPAAASQALYLDGELVASGSSSTAMACCTGLSVYFGRNPADTFDFTGMIADVRLYTRALTATEARTVSRILRSGQPIDATRVSPAVTFFGRLTHLFLPFFK